MSDPIQTSERVTDLLDVGRIDDAVTSITATVAQAGTPGAVRAATALVCTTLTDVVNAGRASTALRWIDDLLERTDPTPQRAGGATPRSGDGARNAESRGRLLAARAGVLRTMHRSRDALEDQQEAQRALTDLATETQLATLDHDRAVLLADLGELNEAVSGLVAAREAFLAVRDRVGVAASDHNLAFVLHDLGALDDAVEYLNEARDIFLTTGMDEEAASCDQNLGVVFYDAGRLADAGRRFAAAHQRFTANDAQISAAECAANLSTVLEAMERPDEAARYRERAESVGVGMPSVPGTSTQVPAVSVEGTADAAQPSVNSGSVSA